MIQQTNDRPTPYDDALLTPTEACRLFPRPSGQPIHLSCVYRWAKKGVAGHRLRVVHVGGSLRTTRRWLREFGADVARAKGYATAEGS
jgi:hypothetical protein